MGPLAPGPRTVACEPGQGQRSCQERRRKTLNRRCAREGRCESTPDANAVRGRLGVGSEASLNSAERTQRRHGDPSDGLEGRDPARAKRCRGKRNIEVQPLVARTKNRQTAPAPAQRGGARRLFMHEGADLVATIGHEGVRRFADGIGCQGGAAHNGRIYGNWTASSPPRQAPTVLRSPLRIRTGNSRGSDGYARAS